jgi:hypothetical protein
MDGLLYLYGLIPTKEAADETFPSLKGFDGNSEIYTLSIKNITAIVCSLESGNYSEEVIKEKTNDMEWLQEKAFHHHETVQKLSKIFTIIPLKFCTMYKSKASLENAIRFNQAKMLDALAFISGNEEWNLKIYCDDQLLKKQVSKSNPTIEAKREEISRLSRGKQFFKKKELDRLIESELEEEKNKVSEKIHKHLKEFTLKGHVKRTWNKDVTGRKDSMAWNGVYLISEPKVEGFLKQIQQYEEDMKEKGWQFETTGPWPAYHFSSFS